MVLSPTRLARAWPLAAHAIAALPLGWLAWQVARLLRGEAETGLGVDPVDAITHFTGEWALHFLVAGLAMTPLRRLAGWAWPLRLRRMLGLWAFAFATLHFATWVVLDLRMDWGQVGAEILERPYLTVGATAWLLLLPLAATSTRGAMRRLGRRWGLLHRLVYAVGVLAVVHYAWLVKADLREPLAWAAAVAVLLGLRLAWRWRARRRDAARAPQPGGA